MVIGKVEIKSKTSVYDNYDVQDFWRMFTEDPSLSINNQATALKEVKKRCDNGEFEINYSSFLSECLKHIYEINALPKIRLLDFNVEGETYIERQESLLSNFGCYDVKYCVECGAVLY